MLKRWGSSLLLIAVLGGCTPVEHVEVACPQRIASLAPSVTETLYALGLGSNVVGVTDFCDYPPDATNKMVVGNYASPDLEAVVRLAPDLVIMLPSAQGFGERLEALNINTLVVRQESVDDILDSIGKIGVVCCREAEGQTLVGRLRDAMAVQPEVSDQRSRVLFVVGHEETAEGYGNLYVAGADGFYSHLVELAGGTNAYEGRVVYPQISREGLLRLDPDVIIDIMADPSVTKEQVLAVWKRMDALKAVRAGRIYIFDQDYASIPGPRFNLLLKDIRRAVSEQ